MSVDKIVMQGIVKEFKKIGFLEAKISLPPTIMGIRIMGIRISEGCSFTLRNDAKLIKNCEAPIIIDLHNPNYMNMMEAAAEFCNKHKSRCNCSDPRCVSEWKEIEKKINADQAEFFKE